jgi:archaellum biogenesis ATPase FlaH
MSEATIIEENSNQILDFTREVKNVPDSDKIKILQISVENLKYWNAGAIDTKLFDCYFVLNFKKWISKITLIIKAAKTKKWGKCLSTPI